jgi:hypothetical protein
MIDSIAICGPLDLCQRRLDETIESGATLVLVPIPQAGTNAEKCRLIESLVG